MLCLNIVDVQVCEVRKMRALSVGATADTSCGCDANAGGNVVGSAGRTPRAVVPRATQELFFMWPTSLMSLFAHFKN